MKTVPFKNTVDPKVHFISAIAVLSVYFLIFLYFDKPIAYAMQHLRNTWIYQISNLITNIAQPKSWTAISILGLGLTSFAHFLYGKKRWVLNSYFLFSSLLLTQFIGEILKLILSRYRPFMFFQQNLYGFHFFSFQRGLDSTPSGHTFSIFAIMTALTYLKPRYSWIFFTIALTLSLTRIILNVHYFSDVLLGAYIGITTTMILSSYFLKPYHHG